MRGLGQCGVGAEGAAQDATRNRYKDLGICVYVHTCMYSDSHDLHVDSVVENTT